MRVLSLLILLFLSATLYAQDPVAPVQAQLDAYNKRDIEAFLKPYSDSVAVYFFPNRLLYKGKETMRKEYTDMFTNTPDLYCTLKSRMVVGSTVIDEESVIFNKTQPPLHAAAIYKVEKGLIVAVYFVSE